MKNIQIKVLIISFLYLTSISLIGWNGNEYQSQNMSNLVQPDESNNTDFYDSLLVTEDHYLEYNTVPSQNFLTQETENAPFEIISEPLGKPMLSIESVQYTSHSPIVIINDDDFTRQNFTGKGTAEDPYQITDFEITTNSTHLITIMDTTAYFNISNNQLNGVSGLYDGILLDNVKNGIIGSNEIFSCMYGVRLFDSSNLNITTNVIHDNNLNGIYLVRSSDILVESNNPYSNVHGISLTDSWNNEINRNWVEDNTGQGIALSNSSFVDVVENDIVSNNQKGIFDSQSQNNSFIGNYVGFNSNDGIYGYNTNYSKILGNYCVNNSWNGIVSQGNSTGLFISQNHAYNNSNVGIRLEYMSFSTVQTNYIYQNGEHGIWLYHSQSNVIRNNDVDKNLLDGIFLEGGSNDNSILENTLYENKRGIRIDDSTNSIIHLNTIDFSTAQGILVLSAENIEISNNLITKSWGSGMWLSDITYGIIKNNDLYENVRASLESTELGGAGIIAAAFGGNISGNHIGFNYYWGIMVMNSEEHDISHNLITNNSNTGIVLQNTNGTTVNNNEMAGNLGSGMLLNNSNGNQVLYNGIYENGANGITIINSNSNYIHHNDILGNYGSTIGFPIRFSLVSEESMESIIIIDRIIYSIKGSTSGHGIFLDPSNGNTIEFNNIYGNTGSGAYLYEASNTDFNENVVADNGENGVFLENSSDNRLIGNIVTGNGGSMLTSGILNGDIKFSIQGSTSGHGIFLDPSMRNTIKGNEISHNVLNGIALFGSEESIIDDNIITKNGNGIYLEDSGHNSITYNTISKNGGPLPVDGYYPDIKFSITGSTSGHGIFLDPSDYNTIDHNTIFGNENLGIYLMDSDYVTITNNSISVNRLYGVFADVNSDGTTVSQNDFNSNNWVYDDGQHDDGLIRDDGEHGDSQVRDDGEHGDFTGNYWNDLVGDIYYLAGLAENSDTQPAPVPFFPAGYEFTSPTVVYPNGGETLSGVVYIQWQVPSNEKYPENINYYVFYSGDAGSDWFIIPFEKMTESSDSTGQKLLNFKWDTTSVVDGSKYLIRVVAVDEVGSVVSDTSDDVFQVENGIDTTDTTEPRTTDTTTPSITPAWTIIGSLVSIGSCGWLTVRKNRNKKK